MIMIILSAMIIGSFLFGLIPVLLFTSSMDCRTCMYGAELLSTKFQIEVPSRIPFELMRDMCIYTKSLPDDECIGLYNESTEQLSYIWNKVYNI